VLNEQGDAAMKWKGTILLLVAVTLGSVGTAQAETAVGAVFGYPGNVGLSLRFDHTPLNVAWSDNFIHGTLDMWLKKSPMSGGKGKMSLYYGVGVDAGIPLNNDNDFFLAGRVPIGIQFMTSPKLELFGELAPGVQILNDVDFYWAGNVGIRFVLGK
jgi:hypothetical protein